MSTGSARGPRGRGWRVPVHGSTQLRVCIQWYLFPSLSCRNIAAVVGTLYLLRKIISLMRTLWGIEKAYFLAPWGIFRTNLKKYGPWAGECGTSSVTVACLVNHISTRMHIPMSVMHLSMQSLLGQGGDLSLRG